MYYYRPILLSALNHWTSNNWQSRLALRQGFLDHYTHVRAVVPTERLLEIEVKDGWAPLCDFLGLEVPKGTGENEPQNKQRPFPHINDGASVVKLHEGLFWWRAGAVAINLLWIAGALKATALAIWWGRRA